MFPRSPRLVSFPCFSTAPSRFLSSFPRKLRTNRQFHGLCEPRLRTEAGLGPKSADSLGKIPGILRVPGKPRVYLENTRYFAGFLGFASDFAPDQLSDSGYRETGELTEWSSEHPLEWKFPETQSAGDPLVSFLISGNNMGTGQCAMRPSQRSGRLSLSVMKNFTFADANHGTGAHWH